MSQLDKQVQVARRRLNTNTFLTCLVVGLIVAAGLWAATVLVDRLFELGIPLVLSLYGGLALAVVVGLIGTLLGRATPHGAALAIDKAAGLKERVSTGLAMATHSEPFALAARHDADDVAARIHVPTHIPIRAPGSWPWTLAVFAFAGLLYGLLPQMNLLAAEVDPDRRTSDRVLPDRKAVEVALKEHRERVEQRIEKNPQLKGLMGDLDKLELSDDPDLRPDDIRRDVVKKVERISDRLKSQLSSDEMKTLEALKKQLAKLDAPDGKDPASKLGKALQSGDMKQAKAAMEDLKKELEDAQQNKKLTPAQKQQLAQMKAKLDDLSKQMQQLADNKKMQKELENKAGLSEEQAKKLLEKMKDMDPKQLEKALQQAMSEAGKKIDPEAVKKLAEKMMQNQQMQQQMQQMAQAMQQAAQAAQQAGQQGEDGQQGQGQGMQSLDAAMGGLSDLEMAEQMMNELEAQLSELEDLKDGMNGQGPGQRMAEGNENIGGQGPQEGLGYGASTGKKTASHGFKARKVKSKMRGGEIIGQMLVDGPQVKGELTGDAREAMAAAQRDATEAIEREEIPRQYWKVVREFTESMAGLAPPAEAPGQDAPADTSGGE